MCLSAISSLRVCPRYFGCRYWSYYVVDRRRELFTFLDYAPLVSPYNKHSEQQMRGPVMCRRISQGNRSLAGATAQAILMSLFRSMELQGRNPVDAVLRLGQAPIVLPLDPDEIDQLAA